MNGFLKIGVFGLALAFTTLGCQQDGVNTDLVNNPETASGEVNKENLPVMTFDEEVFDFGEITQGEEVFHSYKFKNTGKSDLIITSAEGSCGCTVPVWPKEPIAPGDEGEIEVKFNSQGKKNAQHKKVTILANTHPSTNVIALKGNVIAPEKEDS
ncbi:MAG: DUF1573 domain-containing protein [Flavobacteriales bacterium]|nr:DUF1573 domain-containing protein [Flavobacteriales bacterium]